MDYKEFKESIVDSLSENLSEEKQQEFKQFLANHPEYKKEFKAAQLLWNGVEEDMPEPTLAMDVKFYNLLNVEENRSKKFSLVRRIEKLLLGSFQKQLAYTFVILIVGFFVGNGIGFEKKSSEKKLKIAKQETEEVRSELVLTLLDQPSATKRLQAVSEVNKLNAVTETIIKALFSTLNNDENVNVRLSAIEALKNYVDIPSVREGLIASIIHQKFPLVQVELADLMVKLQEKKAVKSFEKLIKEEGVNESAKEKMQESVQQII